MRLLTPRDLSTETGNDVSVWKMEYHVQWKRWLLLLDDNNSMVSWTPNQPHVILGVDGLSGDINSFTIDQRNGDVIFDGYRGRDRRFGRLRDGKVEWISTEESFPSRVGFSDLCISKTGVIYGVDADKGLIHCMKPNNALDPQYSYSLSTLKIGSTDIYLVVQVMLAPVPSNAETEKTLVVQREGLMDVYIINLESGEFTALIKNDSEYVDSAWLERDAKERGAKSILRTALNKWRYIIPLFDTKLLFVGSGPAHVYDLNTDKLIVLTGTETPNSSDEWVCAAIDPTNNRDLYLASSHGDICMLPKFLPL